MQTPAGAWFWMLHFHPVAIVEVQPVIHILQADPRGGVSGFLAFLWCKLLVQEGNLLFPMVAVLSKN